MSSRKREPKRRDDEPGSSSAAADGQPPSRPARGGTKLSRRHRRTLIILFAPVLLLVVAFAAARGARSGEILDGVRVADVDLSGKDRAAADKQLRSLATELGALPLTVRIASQEFELAPDKVAYHVDIDATLDAALAAGREGGVLSQLRWWLASFSGVQTVSMVASLDSPGLEQLVSDWEQAAIAEPPFEGAVVARGGRIAADYPRSGQGVDRGGLDERVLRALGKPTRAVLDLPLQTIDPRRQRSHVDGAVSQARKLVDGEVVLAAELPEEPEEGSRADRKPAESDEGAVTEREVQVRFSRSQLIAALRSKLNEGDHLALELHFDSAAVGAALQHAKAKLERPAQDASFRIGKRDRITIVPSRPSAVIHDDEVAAALLAAARTAERRGALPVAEGEAPKFTAEQARTLGIVALVAEYSTRHPCCKPRVKNIHRIADLIDGTVLEPGATFSLNEIVGPRTQKKGFVLAPGIEEGEMKDSVGGGISQFATTLFNAVLLGGYDVVERAPHTWYFKRYPMGWDATLSFPEPDLKFRNDTAAGLLVKAEYSKTTITIRLFGDAEGRKVKTKKSHPTDVVHPPIKHIADDSLEPDEEKTKYNGRVGWSVYVSRTVIYADGTDKKQRRKITYKPRPKELRVHPCKVPKGEEGYTGKRCPKTEEAEEDEEDDKPKPPDRADPPPKPKDPPKAPKPPAEPPPGEDGAGAGDSAADLIPPELLGK